MRQIISALLLLATSPVLAASNYSDELFAISLIESSAGANMNHPVVLTGIHKGTRAGGRFGMMPFTVQHLIRKSSELREKYAQLLDADPDDITDLLNTDRKFDQEIASHFWKRLRHYFGPARAAYSWYHGPGGAILLDQNALQNDEYVKKFMYLMKRHNKREFASAH